MPALNGRMLITPTVHLNGSSKDLLLRQYQEAFEALDAAIGALQMARPHGRDYYIQDNRAFHVAIEQHRERLKALETVRTELRELYQAVMVQS
jgi:hypothetical protein